MFYNRFYLSSHLCEADSLSTPDALIGILAILNDESINDIGVGRRSGIHAFFELRKRQFLDGPLTRVGEIAYPNFELDDVAKSVLPLTRLDAGKGRNPSQRGRFFF